MTDAVPFAELVLLVAAVALAAVLSNRLAGLLRIPTPGLLLIVTAVIVQFIPALHEPNEQLVERVVTIALVCILFEGGMHMGWRRFRTSLAAISVVGVVGTFLTAAGVALVLHLVFGLEWYPSLLVATAIAPTDPAVVFSVLGQREITGRSGTILEGESGANDPVGIALMAGLIGAGGISGGAFGTVAAQFALQMVIGGVIGYVGGRGLIWFVRRVPLPGEGLYPLRSLACVLVIFGVATVAHGSGFLAVFVAGILIGDKQAPFQREVQRFHSALASLGEIVAFVLLGMTIDLATLLHPDVWIPGLVIAALLAAVIRPLLVGPLLARIEMTRNEKIFILLSGLKGAVPILLGIFILATPIAHTDRLYGIVVIVVVFSVLVQGSAVPWLAGKLGIPMRRTTLQPWAVGIRLADEPTNVRQVIVGPGAPAVGRPLRDIVEDAFWITLLLRDRQIIPVNGDTALQPDDTLLLLSDDEHQAQLTELFTAPNADAAQMDDQLTSEE